MTKGYLFKVLDRLLFFFYFSEYLIQQGADVNIKHPLDPKWSALIQTVLDNAIETCQLLVSAGADVNAIHHSDDTPLHLAAFQLDCFKLSQILISGGANPNAKSIQGLTPLHWAVRSNDLVRECIAKGFFCFNFFYQMQFLSFACPVLVN